MGTTVAEHRVKEEPVPVYSESLPHAVSGGSALDVATWLARRGYPVHPLAPGAKTPAANCPDCRGAHHSPATCPCHSEGRWCHGFHAATTDLRTLRRWWRAEPGFGIGVSCGPARLVVIDVDAHPAPVPDRRKLLPGIPIDDRVDLTGLRNGHDTLALLAAYRSRPHPCEDASTLARPHAFRRDAHLVPGAAGRPGHPQLQRLRLAGGPRLAGRRPRGGRIHRRPDHPHRGRGVRGAARRPRARAAAAVADRRTRAHRPRPRRSPARP
ncbi:bifunctional DNA primase/polymerase [Streptomyces sp. CS62]|uniref:bifunctional DNA primase/polymerase n=1 Tax=Streptomyces sp. CS62 TaxID=3119268 RepID=UPI003FA78CD9